MASSSSSSVFTSSLVALTAFAMLIVSTAPVHARTLIETDDVSPEVLCATSSYKDLCFAMLKNGRYKDEFEMAASVFQQASQKIREAIGESQRLGNAGGAQAKYINKCTEDYKQAEKAMGAAISAFSHPITDWERWNPYINATLEAVRDTYACIATWEDSKPTERFVLEEVSTNLYRFMFNTYDLGSKVQIHTS